MGFHLPFIFRHQPYSCTAFIDTTEYPGYVFTIQNDATIIKEFGDEISVKTDGSILLAKEDDYSQLVEIRQAIFDSLSQYPVFLSVKASLKKSRSYYFYHPTGKV